MPRDTLPSGSTSGLSDAELRASPVPVSGTVTSTPSGTQPVSGTVTANAGTGPFPVSDNAGSLTVDAPVGTPVFTRLSDGTSAVTVTGGRLTVDGSGVTQPVSGSVTVSGTVTNTPSAVGAGTAAAAGRVTFASDAPAIPITDNGGSITVDGAVTTSGTVTNTPSAVGAGTAAAAGRVTFASDAPAIPITDNAGSLTVDYATTGSGTATGALRVELPTNGTGTLATVSTVTSLTQLNGVAIALNTGTRSAGTQRVTIATDDLVPVSYATTGSGTATGALRVELPTNGTGTLSTVTNLAQMNGVAIALNTGVRSAGTRRVTVATDDIVQVVGELANDAVDSGNPQKIGGQARTTNPTAVADADRVNAIFDKLGKQVVVGSIRDLKTDAVLTLTASTAETTLLAQSASIFNDLYGLIIENTSATGTEVEFRDTTGLATPRFTFYVPPTDTRGFMLSESAAFKQSTVNTNWTAKCGTSVSSIKITGLFVKNT